MNVVRNLKRRIPSGIVEHAPHWQDGIFDHLLRGTDIYSQKWEYVRHKPVRAGLAVSHRDWPYQGGSSGLPL